MLELKSNCALFSRFMSNEFLLLQKIISIKKKKLMQHFIFELGIMRVTNDFIRIFSNYKTHYLEIINTENVIVKNTDWDIIAARLNYTYYR